MKKHEALELGFIDEVSDGFSQPQNMMRNAMLAQSKVKFDLCAMVSKMESFEINKEIKTIRDAEKTLIASGISKKEAQAIISAIKNIPKEQNSAVDLLNEFAQRIKDK